MLGTYGSCLEIIFIQRTQGYRGVIFAIFFPPSGVKLNVFEGCLWRKLARNMEHGSYLATSFVPFDSSLVTLEFSNAKISFHAKRRFHWQKMLYRLLSLEKKLSNQQKVLVHLSIHDKYKTGFQLHAWPAISHAVLSHLPIQPIIIAISPKLVANANKSGNATFSTPHRGNIRWHRSRERDGAIVGA